MSTITLRIEATPALTALLERLLAALPAVAAPGAPADDSGEDALGVAQAPQVQPPEAIAAPAPAPSGKATPWTPERLALLDADYSSAPSVKVFAARLNALPGFRLTIQAVYAKAFERGLRRDRTKWGGAPIAPAAAPEAVTAPVPPPAPVLAPGVPAAPAQPRPPGDVVRADRTTILAWAAPRGLAQHPFDLAHINAKRRQLGLPLFELETWHSRGAASGGRS